MNRITNALLAAIVLVACSSGADTSPNTESTAHGTDGAEADENSDWCVAINELTVAMGGLESMGLDPSDVRAQFELLLPMYESVAVLAPPEIRAAVDVSLDGVRQLDAALAAADYDVATADLSVMAALDEQMADADASIEAYNETVCGIVADGSSGTADEPTLDPAGDSMREQLIAQFIASGLSDVEATCIVDGLDLTDIEALSDEAFVAELLSDCGVDPEALIGSGG